MNVPQDSTVPKRGIRSGLVLLGAVVFGGLAVFAASRYISQTISAEKARLNPNVEMMDVVVAKTDLSRGDIVTSDNMAVRQVPRIYVPGTAVLPDQFGNVEGARLAVDIRSGEVLIRGTLEGADVSTFATNIRSGVRGMTVAVDEVNSISGLLQPGDRVDLFFTAKPPNRANRAGPQDRTLVLMQNVLVLATGRQVRPTIGEGGQPGVGRAFTTVTIEASPNDAQRLILAQRTGSITAVLRGPDDKAPLLASAMDASSLFGIAEPARRAPDNSRRAEIIVGGTGRMLRESLRLPALPAGAAAAAPALAARETPPASDVEAARVIREILQATRPVSAEAVTMDR